jgi:hypothetical protein
MVVPERPNLLTNLTRTSKFLDEFASQALPDGFMWANPAPREGPEPGTVIVPFLDQEDLL